uniref:Uncharacterized protein n=1 Tax=viral metagenome TaxID=1070528 RepID=A0A6C0KCX5_9ZZZZ
MFDIFAETSAGEKAFVLLRDPVKMVCEYKQNVTNYILNKASESAEPTQPVGLQFP